jgi:putative transposase
LTSSKENWKNAIRQFLKEKLELIMREEIKHFLEIEWAEISNMRKGYYQWNLDTQYSRIEWLLVPRDRNGEFHTQLFAPYQRHTGWQEEVIIRVSKWHEYMRNWQVYQTNSRKYLFSSDDQPYYRCREKRHRKMAPSSTIQALFDLIFGRFVRETSPRYGRERSHLCGVRSE